MYEWYPQMIGLAPSDFVERDGKPITCFFHVDRQKVFSDHHAWFFKPAKLGQKPSVAHATFEIHVQQLGHDWLEKDEYEPVSSWQDPELRRRLRQELFETFPDVAEIDPRKMAVLPVVEAVMKETMRLYPVIPGPCHTI